MSKKHFIKLADALKWIRPNDRKITGLKYREQLLKEKMWNDSVVAVADVCKSVNGLFQREKFYTACGGLFEL